MDGGEVEKYYRDGPIKDRPILRERRHNTYRVWLRYEGQLTRQSYEASGANLQKFLEGRNGATSETVKTIEADLTVRRRVRTARLRSSLIVNDFGNNSRLAVSHNPGRCARWLKRPAAPAAVQLSSASPNEPRGQCRALVGGWRQGRPKPSAWS